VKKIVQKLKVPIHLRTGGLASIHYEVSNIASSGIGAITN